MVGPCTVEIDLGIVRRRGNDLGFEIQESARAKDVPAFAELILFRESLVQILIRRHLFTLDIQDDRRTGFAVLEL